MAGVLAIAAVILAIELGGATRPSEQPTSSAPADSLAGLYHQFEKPRIS